MRVVPGVEYDIDYSVTMHILGLGIVRCAGSEADACGKRSAAVRGANEAMFARLREIGCPIEDAVEGDGLITRLHMANALVKKGYAQSRAEAFDKFLLKGRPAFVRSENISIAQAVARHACGRGHRGVGASLPDPGGQACRSARGCARWHRWHRGVLPRTTEGERTLFLSLAQQYGLIVTCGSDFHGANRPAATLGCAFAPTPLLLPRIQKGL